MFQVAERFISPDDEEEEGKKKTYDGEEK